MITSSSVQRILEFWSHCREIWWNSHQSGHFLYFCNILRLKNIQLVGENDTRRKTRYTRYYIVWGHQLPHSRKPKLVDLSQFWRFSWWNYMTYTTYNGPNPPANMSEDTLTHLESLWTQNMISISHIESNRLIFENYVWLRCEIMIPDHHFESHNVFLHIKHVESCLSVQETRIWWWVTRFVLLNHPILKI